VYDAVKSLVRAGANQIALRTRLPNGTVYVVLRALVAAGRVAKTDTARGMEYSLTSTGSVQPFKRVRVAAAGSADGERRGAAGEQAAPASSSAPPA
jgi:hypothetical protein